MLEAMRVHQRRTIQEKVQETVQVQEEIHIQMAMDVMTAQEPISVVTWLIVAASINSLKPGIMNGAVNEWMLVAVQLVQLRIALNPAKVNLDALIHIAIAVLLYLQMIMNQCVIWTQFQKDVAKHAVILRLMPVALHLVQTHFQTAT